MTCLRCKCKMVRSKAYVNVPTGEPDFPVDKFATTMSYGKDAKLVDCLKCPSCGHSVKIKEESND